MAKEVGLGLRGAYLNLDGGFDPAHKRYLKLTTSYNPCTPNPCTPEYGTISWRSRWAPEELRALGPWTRISGAHVRVASIAPSSQMLCWRVSGMTKRAIRNMINGSPMGYANAHPTLFVDR